MSKKNLSHKDELSADILDRFVVRHEAPSSRPFQTRGKMFSIRLDQLPDDLVLHLHDSLPHKVAPGL